MIRCQAFAIISIINMMSNYNATTQRGSVAIFFDRSMFTQWERSMPYNSHTTHTVKVKAPSWTTEIHISQLFLFFLQVFPCLSVSQDPLVCIPCVCVRLMMPCILCKVYYYLLHRSRDLIKFVLCHFIVCNVLEFIDPNAVVFGNKLTPVNG